MKKDNRKKGGTGERLAEKYLMRMGYRILERNWGTKWGEIDLICTKDNVLVFVEVKLKVGDRFGTPEEMVNKRKLGQIMRMAGVYESMLTQKRIDVVAIVMNETTKEAERINHYEGVSL